MEIDANEFFMNAEEKNPKVAMHMCQEALRHIANILHCIPFAVGAQGFREFLAHVPECDSCSKSPDMISRVEKNLELLAKLKDLDAHIKQVLGYNPDDGDDDVEPTHPDHKTPQ